MMNLFGTDGVRGRANVLLTPEFVVQLARATAATLGEPGHRVIIGRDTRTSGPMIEAALASGFSSAGMDVLLAGIIPTPAIAFLIKDARADLGAIVSASHNPPGDNGIKLFDGRGHKLSVELEREIEAAFKSTHSPAARAGRVEVLEAAAASYAAFLAGTIDVEEIDLSEHKIVVDCAYGATGKIAPHVLRHLGAVVIELNCSPDGERINQECGSTHLDFVRHAVAEQNADLGVAFDGDGDRVLLVTSTGRTIDGDEMMGIAALHMQQAGTLVPPVVVATEMSNLGLERTLGEAGIELLRTPVGDRNVSQALQSSGGLIGGEQSGHIIFADHSTTGDGILTAVKLLEVAHEAGKSLEELAGAIARYPQVHHAVPSNDPAGLAEDGAVRRAVEAAQEALADHGRIIVRPSGTQPVLRLTVEAQDPELCMRVANALETTVRSRAS